jgi:mannose-6-phosphate isomerase-like protein (cupin superfamily)
MKVAISYESKHHEFRTQERCSMLEIWNSPDDSAVSIARATVDPGVTTQRHILDGVDERLLIVSGSGIFDVGELRARRVAVGDVVAVPAHTPQRVHNDTEEPLVFYCICTPRFMPACYRSVE